MGPEISWTKLFGRPTWSRIAIVPTPYRAPKPKVQFEVRKMLCWTPQTNGGPQNAVKCSQSPLKRHFHELSGHFDCLPGPFFQEKASAEIRGEFFRTNSWVNFAGDFLGPSSLDKTREHPQKNPQQDSNLGEGQKGTPKRGREEKRQKMS